MIAGELRSRVQELGEQDERLRAELELAKAATGRASFPLVRIKIAAMTGGAFMGWTVFAFVIEPHHWGLKVLALLVGLGLMDGARAVFKSARLEDKQNWDRYWAQQQAYHDQQSAYRAFRDEFHRAEGMPMGAERDAAIEALMTRCRR